MAKKLSNDYRLWVESATPGTFNEVKGNQTLSISRTGGTIDATSKDDFPYGSVLPGSRTVTLAAGFAPNLPDANGYTRLEGVARASVATPIGIQVRKGGAAGVAPGDVVFQCSMYVTEDTTGLDQNSPVTSRFSFGNAAAPTVDALA